MILLFKNCDIFTKSIHLCKYTIIPCKGNKNIRPTHKKNACFFIYYIAYCPFYAFLTFTSCRQLFNIQEKTRHEIAPQLRLLRRLISFNLRHSTRFSSRLQSGSPSTISRAISRTNCNNCSSFVILAIFRSKAMPLC